MPKPKKAAVTATGQWTGPGGIRSPAGSVHAWVEGTNSTVCGLQLSRERLLRFPHVVWADVQQAGREDDEVESVCQRCAAGMGARRDAKPWRRVDPRP